MSRAQNLSVVDSIDLHRYAGTWYEIARLPNRFQTKCAANVVATYEVMENGEFKVVNCCLRDNGDTSRAEGVARRAGSDLPNSKLKVRFAPAVLSFLPFVWGDYWIIDLAPDYSYAVIGEPKREYFWVLARTPKLDRKTLDGILERAKKQGYDFTTLILTTQADR